MELNDRLWVGWDRYIDVVERGWECWVYFHGSQRIENGVYIQARVEKIDYEE